MYGSRFATTISFAPPRRVWATSSRRSLLQPIAVPFQLEEKRKGRRVLPRTPSESLPNWAFQLHSHQGGKLSATVRAAGCGRGERTPALRRIGPRLPSTAAHSTGKRENGLRATVEGVSQSGAMKE